MQGGPLFHWVYRRGFATQAVIAPITQKPPACRALPASLRVAPVVTTSSTIITGVFAPLRPFYTFK